MIIDISTDLLIESSLTANQYLLSYLIYERAFNSFETWKLAFPKVTEEGINALLEKEFIVKTSNRMGYTVTQNFLDSVIRVSNFEELLSVFPIYVIRSDNTKDYLRTDRDRCKRRYTNITKSKNSRHPFIIKCLKYEIATRKVEGGMQYMKRLPNWLASKEWEGWAERMENEPLIKDKGAYGTELE